MRSGNGVVTASVPALAESDEAPQAEFTMASPVSNCVPGETPGDAPNAAEFTRQIGATREPRWTQAAA